jgi:hypothetical protein
MALADMDARTTGVGEPLGTDGAEVASTGPGGFEHEASAPAMRTTAGLARCTGTDYALDTELREDDQTTTRPAAKRDPSVDGPRGVGCPSHYISGGRRVTVFERGDHVRVWRPLPGFWHHGVYVGDASLIHYSGEVGRKRDASICRVSGSEFLSGTDGEVVPHDRSFTPNDVVARAETRLGETGYHVVFRNCEHFANWCKEGDARSEHVRRAPLVPLVARGARTLTALVGGMVAAPVVVAVAPLVAGALAARATWKWISKKT